MACEEQAPRRRRPPPRRVAGFRSLPRVVRRDLERAVLDPDTHVSRKYVKRMARSDAEADAYFDFYALLLQRGDVDPWWNPRCLVACARNWLSHTAMGLPGAGADVYLAPLMPHADAVLEAVAYSLCEECKEPLEWRGARMREAVAVCRGAAGLTEASCAGAVSRVRRSLLAVDPPLAAALEGALGA